MMHCVILSHLPCHPERFFRHPEWCSHEESSEIVEESRPAFPWAARHSVPSRSILWALKCLIKPSKANAATTVLARVGMAEPQRVSPKRSLAFLGLSGHDRCREIPHEFSMPGACFFVDILLYCKRYTHRASMRQRIAYFGEFFCL